MNDPRSNHVVASMPSGEQRIVSVRWISGAKNELDLVLGTQSRDHGSAP